jgi:hypothetical protein
MTPPALRRALRRALGADLSPRTRAALAAAALSAAFLVTLALTWAPLADRTSALPFALLAWAGFFTAVAGMIVGRRRARALPSGFALVWLCWWLLTWSDGALDLVAAVRRAAFAFIAF